VCVSRLSLECDVSPVLPVRYGNWIIVKGSFSKPSTCWRCKTSQGGGLIPHIVGSNRAGSLLSYDETLLDEVLTLWPSLSLAKYVPVWKAAWAVLHNRSGVLIRILLSGIQRRPPRPWLVRWAAKRLLVLVRACIVQQIDRRPKEGTVTCLFRNVHLNVTLTEELRLGGGRAPHPF
jgi:hypothetical protein